MGYPYATPQSFYDFLHAEAIVGSARVVKAVDAASDRFLSPGHGLVAGDVLRFELGAASFGGTPALPSPISAFTVYYALPASSDLFSVALTSGGSAVDVTSTGTGLLAFVLDIEASIARHIARAASAVDACLERRGVILPLVGDFPWIESLVIRLCVWPVLLARGYTAGRTVDPDQDYKILYQRACEEFDDLCSGKAPLPSGLPVGALAGLPATSWDLNQRGWTPRGGGI